MESSVQSGPTITDSAYSSSNKRDGNRLATIRQELEYLNTIGKRFVAAFDRFQVHRALLAALRELYSFSACCILLKGDPFELFIIPSYPLSPTFLEQMIKRIASAANVIDFPHLSAEQLATTAYLDAPDELAQSHAPDKVGGDTIGSGLNIPLTVENRIIGMLSLFDEKTATFDRNLLQLTTMIADYAAVALENVRLRERENALWRQAVLERQRLELIISSMTEGLLITDARGAIVSLNHSAQLLLAETRIDLPSDLPIQKHSEAATTPWLARLAEIITQALTGKSLTNQEIIINEESQPVPHTLSISAAPLYETEPPPSRLVGAVVVLNDITSSKQVERLKDEFVSVVSHELRTPLTAIKGYNQHLMRRIERRLRKIQPQDMANVGDLPENYDLRSLNIIQSQTEHLERLVNDLLDLSQVQWGKLDLQYETFYLTDLLAECIHSVQASAEQHTLYLDIQTQNSEITADPNRVRQVVGNILDNAVKYSPQGGTVAVRLQMSDDDYLVSIIDEGIGVGPENFDHIFERFYRVHNTATQQYSGIGLGLYVAKAIIERHGGRIWFTNNQNTGTTFSFTLPQRPRTRPL